MDEEESFIVTLSSLGNRDIYPSNKSSSFTNKLRNGIRLNPNLEYEIGLVNIFYPEEYYGVIKSDGESTVELIINKENFVGDERMPDKPVTAFLQPTVDILSGDIAHVVKAINDEIAFAVGQLMPEATFKKFFSGSRGIFTFDTSHFRVLLTTAYRKERKVDKTSGTVYSIDVKLSERIAKILGFTPNLRYPIFQIIPDSKSDTGYTVSAPFPPSVSSGVDYAIVYSDVVERSCYAGEMVNILGIFNMSGSKFRGVHNTVYYPAASKSIETISIRLADQAGREIHFKEETSLLCQLKIRSRQLYK